MEAAVAAQLASETLCAPWRRSQWECAGCREGMWFAALQFLSQCREWPNGAQATTKQGGGDKIRKVLSIDE